jgi:hypothetical protein
MIRISKPHKAPKVLTTKGKAKTKANIALTKTGSNNFDFDRQIYAHKSVKKALIDAQHDKCFLCESKISHIAYGDVEHFRPKAGYRQSASSSLQKPGYYWLAFEWSNLFFACQLCNQLFKKNLFPLADPQTRVTSPKDSLQKETPLFIDPSSDDPEDDPETLISFREEIPFPLNDNPRGKTTIDQMGLKRRELNERRFEVYERLKTLYLVANKIPAIEESEAAAILLRKSVHDSAEYAGMIRAATNARFLKV